MGKTLPGHKQMNDTAFLETQGPEAEQRLSRVKQMNDKAFLKTVGPEAEQMHDKAHWKDGWLSSGAWKAAPAPLMNDKACPTKMATASKQMNDEDGQRMRVKTT